MRDKFRAYNAIQKIRHALGQRVPHAYFREFTEPLEELHAWIEAHDSAVEVLLEIKKLVADIHSSTLKPCNEIESDSAASCASSMQSSARRNWSPLFRTRQSLLPISRLVPRSKRMDITVRRQATSSAYT